MSTNDCIRLTISENGQEVNVMITNAGRVIANENLLYAFHTLLKTIKSYGFIVSYHYEGGEDNE